MKSVNQFFERVKSAYKDCVVFSVILFILSCIDIFFPSFFETFFKVEIRVRFFVGFLILGVIPLLSVIIKDIKNVFYQSTQFLKLLEEVTGLKEENLEIEDRFNKLTLEHERLKLINQKLLDNRYISTFYEVTDIYLAENEVFIAISLESDQTYIEPFEVFLVDVSDSYSFGQFTDPVKKQGCLHLKNCGEVDRMLLTNLQNNASTKLRPTVQAVRIIKKE